MTTQRPPPEPQTTLDRDTFIENQVAFQFGDCKAAPGLDVADFVRNRAAVNESLILHDPATQGFVPEERGAGLVRVGEDTWDVDFRKQPVNSRTKKRATRVSRLLTGLYASGLRSPVVMNMEDAAGDTDFPFPVFQYNRRAGAKNVILWPFERMHEIGGLAFCSPPDPTETACAQKSPSVVWRGQLRGASTHGGDVRSARSVLALYHKKQIDEAALRAHLLTVPRYAFVAHYFDKPGFDVGFILSEKHPELQLPPITQYEKPYLPREAQLAHRYQIAIAGNDVASSFGWQIATNCVILRESHSYEAFFEGHFAPGEHYVPIAADFSDVSEKIAWCEANLDACQAMVEKRHELVGFLLEQRTRRKALRRVVKRYEEFYRAWAAA